MKVNWLGGVLLMTTGMASAATQRPLSRPPRDLRLDIIRGWLQVSIFGAHAVGSSFGAYGIHAAWGLSDSSEQFLFLSGFVLASVHTAKASRDGCGYGWLMLTLTVRNVPGSDLGHTLDFSPPVRG